MTIQHRLKAMPWIEEIMNRHSDTYDEEIMGKYYMRERQVYSPIHHNFSWVYWIADSLFDYAQAAREAPFLKKSIIDEEMPLKMKLPLRKRGDSCILGGRRPDSMLLGMIRYSQACPELMEAASHDFDIYMRGECINSLRKIGHDAFQYAPGLAAILLNDPSFHVREKAAQALGAIGNPICLTTLRNAFDEARTAVRELEIKVYELGKKEAYESDLFYATLLIENLITSIFDLNNQQGAEVIREGLKDSSPSVRHHTKNVSCLCRTKDGRFPFSPDDNIKIYSPNACASLISKLTHHFPIDPN